MTADFGTSFATASVTISGDLIFHVRKLFRMALEEIAQGRPDEPRRIKKVTAVVTSMPMALPTAQRSTSVAIPSYITAVAAVEAFVNEIFFSGLGKLLFGDAALGEMEDLERLKLGAKLILLPKFAFGRTFDRGALPYQDMALLLKLRNELVHYKMDGRPPSFIRVLAQRGIAKPVPPDQEDGGPHPWADRVSTLEGIFWAHNTACAIVNDLVALAPREGPPTLAALPAFARNFRPISETEKVESLQKAVQAHEAEERSPTTKDLGSTEPQRG